MIILEKQISRDELNSIAATLFGDMIKAVADVRNKVIDIVNSFIAV